MKLEGNWNSRGIRSRPDSKHRLHGIRMWPPRACASISSELSAKFGDSELRRVSPTAENSERYRSNWTARSQRRRPVAHLPIRTRHRRTWEAWGSYADGEYDDYVFLYFCCSTSTSISISTSAALAFTSAPSLDSNPISSIIYSSTSASTYSSSCTSSSSASASISISSPSTSASSCIFTSNLCFYFYFQFKF